MLEMGYDVNRDGVCFGLAHMGLQAVLQGAKAINQFNARLRLIYEISRESQPKTLIESERCVILSFFDGVQLHQQPYACLGLFPDNVLTKNQDATQTLAILSPPELEKNTVHSEHIASGVYADNDITKYFVCLNHAIQLAGHFTTPIGFILTNIDHTICIGYDPQHRSWTIIDVNQLPAQITQDLKTVAKVIERGFQNSTYIIFNTRFFYSAQDTTQATTLLNQLMANPNWLSLHHSYSKNKSKKDSAGATWLHLATEAEDYDAMTALLKAGANPNAKTNHASSPLNIATEIGTDRLLALFSPYSSLFSQSDLRLDSALILAVKKNNTKSVQRLIASGAKVCDFTADGMSLLVIGAMNNNRDMLELLLANGADFNAGRLTDGYTPLHIAVKSEQIEATTLILQYPVDVNSLSHTQHTPLFLAVLSENLAIIRLLLEASDIDVHKTTYLEKSAVESIFGLDTQAMQEHFGELANHFVIPISPFQLARLKNKQSIIDLLMNHSNNTSTKKCLR